MSSIKDAARMAWTAATARSCEVASPCADLVFECQAAPGEPLGCDEGRCVWAIKGMLAMHSPVLRQMFFSGSMREAQAAGRGGGAAIVSSPFSRPAVRSLVCFCETGVVVADRSTIVDLLLTADYYGVGPLFEALVDLVLRSQHSGSDDQRAQRHHPRAPRGTENDRRSPRSQRHAVARRGRDSDAEGDDEGDDEDGEANRGDARSGGAHDHGCTAGDHSSSISSRSSSSSSSEERDALVDRGNVLEALEAACRTRCGRLRRHCLELLEAENLGPALLGGGPQQRDAPAQGAGRPHRAGACAGGVAADGTCALWSLSEDALVAVVSRDGLAMEEVDVFRAVVNWGREQLAARLAAARAGDDARGGGGEGDGGAGATVGARAWRAGATGEDRSALAAVVARPMRAVRFPLMSPMQLVQVVQPSGLVDPGCIIEALAYQADPNTRVNTQRRSNSSGGDDDDDDDDDDEGTGDGEAEGAGGDREARFRPRHTWANAMLQWVAGPDTSSPSFGGFFFGVAPPIALQMRSKQQHAATVAAAAVAAESAAFAHAAGVIHGASTASASGRPRAPQPQPPHPPLPQPRSVGSRAASPAGTPAQPNTRVATRNQEAAVVAAQVPTPRAAGVTAVGPAANPAPLPCATADVGAAVEAGLASQPTDHAVPEHQAQYRHQQRPSHQRQHQQQSARAPWFQIPQLLSVTSSRPKAQPGSEGGFWVFPSMLGGGGGGFGGGGGGGITGLSGQGVGGGSGGGGGLALDPSDSVSSADLVALLRSEGHDVRFVSGSGAHRQGSPGAQGAGCSGGHTAGAAAIDMIRYVGPATGHLGAAASLPSPAVGGHSPAGLSLLQQQRVAFQSSTLTLAKLERLERQFEHALGANRLPNGLPAPTVPSPRAPDAARAASAAVSSAGGVAGGMAAGAWRHRQQPSAAER